MMNGNEVFEKLQTDRVEEREKKNVIVKLHLTHSTQLKTNMNNN